MTHVPAIVIIPTILYDMPKLMACEVSLEESVPIDVPIVRAADQSLSFGENCNRAVAEMIGKGFAADSYIFVNDDTVASKGWYEPFIGALSLPEVGIVGAQLHYPSGECQHSGVYLDYQGVLTAHNTTYNQSSGPREAVTGAVMGIHASLFHALSGFDLGYVNGYEDIDLCLRARATGATIYYQALSTFLHHESGSGPRRWTHVHQNIARLHNTYGESYLDLDGKHPAGWVARLGPVVPPPANVD